MQTVLIKDLVKHIDEIVCIKAWVRNWRKSSSKLRFIILRDGSADIQAVAFKPEMGEEEFENAKKLTIESSVIITGKVEKHPKKEGEVEFKIQTVKPVAESIEYPIGKKEHGPDFLLSQRHLWIRSRKQWAILKIRHTVYSAVQQYLHDNDFIRFDTPIITPNACEGSTTLFEMEYFDLGKAYLSQSGQLYLEAGALSHGRVYDFGPVFRAEKSKTRKHLTEFWMMDAEMSWFEHADSMKLQEELIRFVIKTVLEKCQNELTILERDTEQLKKADAPFKILTHRQAIDFLKEKGVEIGYEDDFGAAEEQLLTEGSDVPVFIEKWPHKIKAFYMKRDPENNDLVLGSDLIAPEGFGEIIGGSQREDDFEILKSRLEAENLSMEDYGWYLDLRKYGSAPHSGFGIGLERLVSWMCGINHIRETIPFPRMIYRIKP